MPSRLSTPRPPSLPISIAVRRRDDAVHGRGEQRQLEQVRPELPADVDVLGVARAPARHDRDVVEAVGAPGLLAPPDLDLHRAIPPLSRPSRQDPGALVGAAWVSGGVRVSMSNAQRHPMLARRSALPGRAPVRSPSGLAGASSATSTSAGESLHLAGIEHAGLLVLGARGTAGDGIAERLGERALRARGRRAAPPAAHRPRRPARPTSSSGDRRAQEAAACRASRTSASAPSSRVITTLRAPISTICSSASDEVLRRSRTRSRRAPRPPSGWATTRSGSPPTPSRSGSPSESSTVEDALPAGLAQRVGVPVLRHVAREAARQHDRVGAAAAGSVASAANTASSSGRTSGPYSTISVAVVLPVGSMHDRASSATRRAMRTNSLHDPARASGPRRSASPFAAAREPGRDDRLRRGA